MMKTTWHKSLTNFITQSYFTSLWQSISHKVVLQIIGTLDHICFLEVTDKLYRIYFLQDAGKWKMELLQYLIFA
jgi:hypothetical protein